MSETPHDPFARECVVVGLPASELHDGPCPACREMSALVDLDPDFGSAEDGRPWIGGDDPSRTTPPTEARS